MIIGGSYPGAVVAFYQAVATQVDAVWSSSGVVHAIEDFSNFDKDILEATHKSSETCSKVISRLTRRIDIVMTLGEQSEKEAMFKAFRINKPWNEVNYFDFMFYIADIFTLGVQYGGRTELCNML